jgi:glycosyltransferase involved in cell wall biosynthesis
VSLSVVIVDSGLRALGGHNYTYTRSVKQAFEHRGANVIVLANRGLGGALEGAGVRPSFSCGAYDHPLGHGRIRDLVYLHAQSHVFAEEVEHALAALSDEPDLIFSHTLADFELLGWARCLRRLPLRASLAALLRHTPRYAGRNALKLAFHPYWRLRPRALARLRSILGSRFLLCTDSVALSEDYARRYAGPILTLPIPLNTELFGESASSTIGRYGLDASGELRIGYLGDARSTKGFPMLPEVVRRLGYRPDLRFVIHCSRPAGWDNHAELPRGVAELQGLASDPRCRVTLVPDALAPCDYAALLRSLHIVLLPYVHEAYREATSGIFAEALALAKPVVVPEGTWMAAELDRAGAGKVFAAASREDFVEKVAAAVESHGDLARRAAETAPAWRAFHSAESVVTQLLEAVGLASARLH